MGHMIPNLNRTNNNFVTTLNISDISELEDIFRPTQPNTTHTPSNLTYG